MNFSGNSDWKPPKKPKVIKPGQTKKVGKIKVAVHPDSATPVKIMIQNPIKAFVERDLDSELIASEHAVQSKLEAVRLQDDDALQFENVRDRSPGRDVDLEDEPDNEERGKGEEE